MNFVCPGSEPQRLFDAFHDCRGGDTQAGRKVEEGAKGRTLLAALQLPDVRAVISAFRAEIVLGDFGVLPDITQHAAKGDFGTDGPPSCRVSHTAMIELLTTKVRHTIVIVSQSPHGETIVIGSPDFGLGKA